MNFEAENPNPAGCADKEGTFKLPSGKEKECQWLTLSPSRLENKCKKEKFQQHCPKTCRVCDAIYTRLDQVQ